MRCLQLASMMVQAVKGKRIYCREVFHVSEYGKTPDDLWEQVSSEIAKRYDLDGNNVYLHGDGASWIRGGLEWIPEAVFVLDKYHKNKAITAQKMAPVLAAGKISSINKTKTPSINNLSKHLQKTIVKAKKTFQ